MIITKMVREKKGVSKNIANTTAPAKMAQRLNLVNFAERYIWAINNANLDAFKKLGITNIKKY